MPGIFEMMLIGQTPESMNGLAPPFRRTVRGACTRRATCSTIAGGPRRWSASLPIGKAIDAHPMALPYRQAGSGAGPFETFGMGQCQCRMAMEVLGARLRQAAGELHGHGPVGRAASSRAVETVSKKEALEIKRAGRIARAGQLDDERRVDPGPVLVLLLRLLLSRDADGQRVQRARRHRPPALPPPARCRKCTHCGKCAQNCPMGAMVVDTAQRRTSVSCERCIGCGLCVLACDRQKALSMEPVPDYRLPYRSWFSLIAHSMPSTLTTSFKIWRERQ